MKKSFKLISVTLALVIFLLGAGIFVGTSRLEAAQTKSVPGTAVADAGQDKPEAPEADAANPDAGEKEKAAQADNSSSGKAFSAALAIGLAALGGTLAMGIAIGKSNDSVARQPEAGGQIQTLLMLGLVFIETVVIYALIVAILIIFVL